MKHSIKKNDLAIYALYLAVFKVYQIPEIMQQSCKLVLLFGVVVYIVSHSTARQLLNKSIPLCISITVSSILSYRAGIVALKSVFDGVLHAICLYLICALVDLCKRKNYTEGLIDCLYKITSVYCLISIISIMLRVNSGNKSEILYFFGYKFMTSYYFIFWLALYYMKYSKHIRKNMQAKALYLLATLFVLLICYWVDCATSMIAVVFVLIWQFLSAKVRGILEHRICGIILVALAGLLPFFMTAILQNNFVQNLVQNVLGRRMTLTGRMPIYLVLKSYIQQRPWFGYGYGNTVIFQKFGYGNAQNGLLEHALLYGLTGVAVLFWTLWMCMKKRRNADNRTNGWYIIFYAMVIASIVEISFNYIFYMALFSLTSFPQNSKKPKRNWRKH